MLGTYRIVYSMTARRGDDAVERPSMNAGTPGRGRLVRAFAFAPLAAPVTCIALLFADALTRATFGSESFPSAQSAAELVAAVGATGIPVAYAAALIGGGPAYLLLRRLGIVTRWTLWLTGGVIGAIVAVLLAPSLHGALFSLPFPWWAGAVLGLASAETFWRLLRVAPRRFSTP